MNVASLQRELEPLAQKLARELAAILVSHYGGEIESVRVAARGYLAKQLDEMSAIVPVEVEQLEVKRPKKRRAKKSKPPIARKPRPPAVVVVDAIPTPAVVVLHHGVKEPRKCTSCKRPGHRADRCPDLETEQKPEIVNAGPAPVNTKPTVVIASPPPPHSEAGSVRANRGCSPCPCPRRGRRVTAMPTRKVQPWLVS